MFSILRSPSRTAAGAIMYVTIGTLMVIWAGLWYYYFIMPQSSPPPWQRFACMGTILSGFAIGIIGLLFGSIGREAKTADNAIGIATPNVIAPTVIDPVVPAAVNGTAIPKAAGSVATSRTVAPVERTASVIQ